MRTAIPRGSVSASAVAIAIIFLQGAPASAQMPGAPALQNAWAAPGIVLAADIAGGGGTSVYGLAGGWAPASGRFQLSAGGGWQTGLDGGDRAVYGFRAALPIAQLMDGKLGIAAFGGIGGGGSDADDTTRSNLMVPAGVAVGYRQAIGTAGRGFSVYLDPMYQYHSGSGDSGKGYFRIAGGIDAGLSARFGLTFGFEAGGEAADGHVGPAGALYGLGISMKLGR